MDDPLEKELKQQSKEAGFTRGAISPSELAVELSKERTQLQFELCKFFLVVNKINEKKGVELLQHMIDYYHTQESYYRDGLKTIEEYRCYVEVLIERLGYIKQDQDQERKDLHELKELLRASPYLEQGVILRSRDASWLTCERPKDGPQGNSERTSAVATNTVLSHGSFKATTSDAEEVTEDMSVSGTLMKRSANKLHKHWQKRKCLVKDGSFFLAHSDETREPVEVKLLTCAVREVVDDKRCFDLITRTRTYHFQAESEQAAKRWVAVIRNVSKMEGSSGVYSASKADKNMKDLLTGIPGNDKCADCGSCKDVTWISTNIGALLCIECSGAHRDMGVHISRIQSIDLDAVSKPELLIPLAVGNQMLNRIFEASLPSAAKINPNSAGQERKVFIENKYVNRKYVKLSENPKGIIHKLDLVKDAVSNYDIANLLKALALELDLNASVFEASGDTALMALVRSDDDRAFPLVEFLLQNGADASLANSLGDTPLHICVQLNRPDYLRLLLRCRLKRGILTQTNKKGQNPLQFAIDRNLLSCQKLLECAIKGDRVSMEDFEIPKYLLNPRARLSKESHLRTSARRALALQHVSASGSNSAPLANTTTDEDSDSMSSAATSPFLPPKARAPPPPPSPFNKGSLIYFVIISHKE